MSNGTGYGIYGEFNSDRQSAPTIVGVHGSNKEFDWQTHAPEIPGSFSFPPLAALITGGAHLLMGMIEAALEEKGGGYVAHDTDSFFLLASRQGGEFVCPGGPLHVLSEAEVRDLQTRFDALSPYDRAIVKKNLLETEAENLVNGQPAQLYAYSTSRKRYVLFNRCDDGRRLLRKVSEHWLGSFMDPWQGKDLTFWTEEVQVEGQSVQALALHSEGWTTLVYPGKPATPEWIRDHLDELWVWRCYDWLLGWAEDSGQPEPAWFAQPLVSGQRVDTPHTWQLFDLQQRCEARRPGPGAS